MPPVGVSPAAAAALHAKAARLRAPVFRGERVGSKGSARGQQQIVGVVNGGCQPFWCQMKIAALTPLSGSHSWPLNTRHPSSPKRGWGVRGTGGREREREARRERPVPMRCRGGGRGRQGRGHWGWRDKRGSRPQARPQARPKAWPQAQAPATAPVQEASAEQAARHDAGPALGPTARGSRCDRAVGSVRARPDTNAGGLNALRYTHPCAHTCIRTRLEALSKHSLTANGDAHTSATATGPRESPENARPGS